MTRRFFTATAILGLAGMAPAMMKAAGGGQVLKGAKEAHPHIRAALRELREARHELETAAHDFGGHRKEAIEAVDNAIRQLQKALEYDRK